MNQLRKLGKRIRDGEYREDSSPNYEEVLEWYDELAAFVMTYLWECDWSSLLGDRPPEIVSRVKTIDTLRDKLQREHRFPLPAIQDIAGVRFEAEMTLQEQDAVVDALMGYFQDMGWEPHKTDYRAKGGHSAYRAVHVVLHFQPIGKVEVQVRTHLQSRWANLYEAMADKHGRQIRYDELPEDPEARSEVESLQELSLVNIAELEDLRVSAEDLRGRSGTASFHEEVESLIQSIAKTERGLAASLKRAEDALRQDLK